MKKVLLVSALVMTIVASMVSGTLAVYQTTTSDIAGDSVVAKRFVLVGEELTSFAAPLKIAPSDKKILSFSVSNGNSVSDKSEVDMSAVATITLAAAATDKLTIEPLIVNVYTGDLTLDECLPEVLEETVVANVSGVKTITFDLVDFDADVTTVETQEFTVVVEWPKISVGPFPDYTYAGPTYETKLTVSVTGTQIAL